MSKHAECLARKIDECSHNKHAVEEAQIYFFVFDARLT